MPLFRTQTYILIIILVSAFSFGVYATRTYRQGPKITVSSPLPYTSVDAVVEVTGFIKKPKEATINGAPLLVTKDGEFRSQVILRTGVDSIDISAVNMYGKESTIHVPVYVRE
jgi:hypothetical protein